MIDWLSIVETDKMIHTVETDIVKLVVEIKSFGMSFDEFDKETGSSNRLQPKQADRNYVHALNELHLHEICVVPSKHEVDQFIYGSGRHFCVPNKEDEGDMDVGWDITVKDVERLRKFLTPTIHTLPNLKPVVQPYMPLGPVHDKEKIVKEEEQDYDIPLHDGMIKPLTPQTVHSTPPDDDYVAPSTSPTLDKQLNKFGKECFDITRVAEKANGNPVEDVQELSDIKTYDCETFIRKLLYQVPAVRRNVLWKHSRDSTRLLGPPIGLKGLLHMLNATVIPTKVS
ncbi:hypothetical protein Tco_0891537 [Tanacetum coccineum]|uniref:Uncharacterized protein n=1 Tax=Tanacetum coccineum TaxID=301880 RepID=A0ABQ5C373_9ASTR